MSNDNVTAIIPTDLNEMELAKNTFKVLKETLYPGASDASVHMVLNYCKARKIDPLLKPVHLVPMNVKTGKKDSNHKDIYEWRDVVMPGIGLYRIDASRTGQYAGMGEPEFGQDITEKVGSIMTTYPKWCKITVKKFLNGMIVEFTAKEYWKENYAPKKKDDTSPNAMWFKRPYGQLAKCAEAQALRKAFPEVLGQEYTHEEMEGKIFKDSVDSQVVELLEHKPTEKAESREPNLMIVNSVMDSIGLMDTAQTMELLTEIFIKASRKAKPYPDLLKQVIEVKDRNKLRLEAIMPPEQEAEIVESSEPAKEFKADEADLEGNPY